MRISELFRMNKWSAGMISVIISGHLVAEIQAQSVAQIKNEPQQYQGTVAPVDSFINDAEKAIGNGELKKADDFLRVAEVMMRQSGATNPTAVSELVVCVNKSTRRDRQTLFRC